MDSLQEERHKGAREPQRLHRGLLASRPRAAPVPGSARPLNSHLHRVHPHRRDVVAAFSPLRTAACGLVLQILAAPSAAQQRAFTLEQVLSPPFPSELVAAPTGGLVAWVFNSAGARNVWVAAPPDYKARQVTSYTLDDGQEIIELAWTPDARAIVYVRGGEPNDKGEYPNPTLEPRGVEEAVWMAGVACAPTGAGASSTSGAASGC